MNNTADPTGDDPRVGFAAVIAALQPLINGSLDQLDASTPCPEFRVKELLEHLVMVSERCAAIGRGEHWSSVEQRATESGWAEAFAAGADACEKAWADSAKLGQMFEVPWATMPGAPVLLSYTAELSVHGWDLATATGQQFEVDDDHLRGALVAAKMIPEEGRDTGEVPFSPVTATAADATIVEQMAAWMGRSLS